MNLFEELEERIQRIEYMLDRLGIRLGKDATLKGGNWEISNYHWAQWLPGTSLPLQPGSQYIRIHNGMMEIREGAIDFHTGETGNRMVMDSDGIRLYDAGDNLLFNLDVETGTVTVPPGNIDHNLLLNTHNLTTDINHNAILNYVANQHINWTNTNQNLLTTGSGTFGSLTATPLNLLYGIATSYHSAGWGARAALFRGRGDGAVVGAVGILAGLNNAEDHLAEVVSRAMVDYAAIYARIDETYVGRFTEDGFQVYNAAGDALIFEVSNSDLETRTLGNNVLVTHTHAGVPAIAPSDGALAVNTNDNTFYFRSGGAWRLLAPGGEANTASNQGAQGTGLYKQKMGVDLEFYKIHSTNNRLSVAIIGGDYMGLTVNEGNIDHNALANYVANRHIDWTAAANAFSTTSSGYFGAGIRINDNPIYLRGGADVNHYIRRMADDWTRFASWEGWEWYDTQGAAFASWMDRHGNMYLANTLGVGKNPSANISLDAEENIRYEGELVSRKEATDHVVQGFHPLIIFSRHDDLWNSSYVGAQDFSVNLDDFERDGTAIVDIPADATAVAVQLIFRADTVGRSARIGPNATYHYAIDAQVQAANTYIAVTGIVPVDNESIQFVSDGSVDNVYVRIWGYFI